jgi:uncharacterized protein
MNKYIKKTEDYVKSVLEKDGSGHDWYHIDRVRKIAKEIAKKEKVDPLVVELGALLHDIADWKFNSGNLKKGAVVSEKWLKGLGLDQKRIEQVSHIVENVSYKGAKVKNTIKSLEGKIVQDADRLDAMGAIGIARAFAYGGHKGRPMYDPKAKLVQLHKTFGEYKKGSASSIHHFYEKLLLIKDMMNTKTGKKLAARRHKLMLDYLKQFHAEWNSKA